MCKEVVMVYFNELRQHMPGRSKENQGSPEYEAGVQPPLGRDIGYTELLYTESIVIYRLYITCGCIFHLIFRTIRIKTKYVQLIEFAQ
jgi:hypothetical protein